MSEPKELTNLHVGIMAAMTAIGTCLASVDPHKQEKMMDMVKMLMESLPDDQSLPHNESEGRLPLKALLKGLSVGRQSQPSEPATPE